MPRGGARPGAGRKRGIPNTRQRAKIVKDLIERGDDPLTYFLSIMKDQNESTTRRDWAAAQAAPYVHPRLQSIDQNNTFKGDALAELMKAIDGRTTGIATGAEPDGGSPLAPDEPVQHH
jgi:hypothetical protein